MNEFTAGEKAFIADLKRNRLWTDILEKLGAFHRDVPAFKPGAGDVEGQSAEWIYWSGVDRGRKDLLKLLSDG